MLFRSAINRGTFPALQFAHSISDDVRAVYVEVDSNRTVALQQKWGDWGEGVPLVVLKSPDRVKSRAGELRDQLAKRGVSEEVLASRGLKKATDLPEGGRTEAGERRSPASWWAAFLLSGDPGPLD